MNNIASQVESQRSLLNDFHHIKIELETAKVRIESYIDQGKLRYAEMLTKITAETKKCNIFFYLFLYVLTFVFIQLQY